MRPALQHSILACLSLALAPLHAEDGSDTFFNAYMSFQKGEKLEAAGKPKEALAAYQAAITTLDQLTRTAPGWNPPMVTYRREKSVEAATRIEALTGKGGAPASRKPSQDDLIGTLPSNSEAIIPGTESFVPPAEKKPASRTSAKPTGNPLQDIQKQIDDLQDDLSKTKSKLDAVTREKEDLAKKYDRAIKDAAEAADKQVKIEKRANMLEDALMKQEGDSAKNSDASKQMRAELDTLKRQLRDAQIDRDAEAELRDQIASRLAMANTKIATISNERDAAKKESAAVPGKLNAMQKEIDKALAEKGDLTTKLSKVQEQLAKVSTERDDAMQQVGKMKEAQKQVDKLMADNTMLMAKLNDAEGQVKTFKADGVEKDKQIVSLKTEMDSVRKQLADTKKQSDTYQTQMSDMQGKLELQAKDLAQLKSDATTTVAERKRLIEENEVLRGIVVRQMKQQALRDKTKQLVLTELGKLEVNSKALFDQIEFLGQPVVKLTDKERKLFKVPTIEISDAEISIAAPKETAAAPVAPATPPPPTEIEKPATPVVIVESKPEPPMLAETKPAAEAKPPVEQPPVVVTPIAPPTETQQPIAEAKPKPSLSIDTGIAPDAGVPTFDLAAKSTPSPSKTTDKPKTAKAATPPPEGELPTKAGDVPPKPVAEKTEMASAKSPETSIPPTDATASIPTTPASTTPTTSSEVATDSGSPAVPAELLTQAREAKEKFDKAEYRDAEKIYEKILTKAPNNLYILSNLGVVRFRAGKLKLAEEAFKKAIAIAPEDAFSHCTLGIVYYSQGKYDEAVNELTKALAINPKNATAHNYLGITASQKGWQEAAQKELETATTFDPHYADAHFNLAVVFATQTPPNKEMARKHYKLAVDLGAEPDAALEQLIK